MVATSTVNLHYCLLHRRRDQLTLIEYEFGDYCLVCVAAADGNFDIDVDCVGCRCSTVRAFLVAADRFDDVAKLDFCVG